jgi:hypothetical protein
MLASADMPANREPPAASLEDTVRQHPRRQQALVDAARAGREPDPDARKEFAWFARLGMSEAEALAYLLHQYPAASADNGAA